MTGLWGKLGWPLAVGASVAAHGAAALWLSGQSSPQREGDKAEPPAIMVAFVPPPAEPPALDLPVPPAPLQPLALDSPPEVSNADPVAQPERSMPAPIAKAEPAPKADTAPPAPKTAKAKAEKPKAPKTAGKPKEKAKPKAKVEAPAAEAAPKVAKAGAAAGNKKWASKIRSRIERKKSYPAAAKGASGVVSVHIRIAASGALAGVKLTGSSGNAALDAAALKAVKSAAPFPAAPAGSSGAEFSLNMDFRQ